MPVPVSFKSMLSDRMGSKSNVSIKRPIDTMLNFDGDSDGHGHGDSTCKQTFNVKENKFLTKIIWS